MVKLFKHAHLIIDEYKEYLDGALLFEDDKILDVFVSSNKLNESDKQVIDLNGLIVMPGFFDPNINHAFDLKNGTTSFIKHKDINIANGSRCLGLYSNDEYLELKDLKKVVIDPLNNKIKKGDFKLLVGHTDAYYKDINEEIDGISLLFDEMRPLDHQNQTLVNWAFNGAYFEINLKDKDESVIKLLLKNIDKDKMFLVSSVDLSINDQMKMLYRLGVNYNDLLRYSGLNAHRFYGFDKLYGTLQKGKRCDFVILDDDLNIKDVYIKGESICGSSI